jgi:hypothetical protein
VAVASGFGLDCILEERPSSGRAMTWSVSSARWDRAYYHELWEMWRIAGAGGSRLEPLTNARGSLALKEWVDSADGAADGAADAEA